jgi:hypothetical protein
MVAMSHSNAAAEHPPEGSRAWFFHEFWPLMLFGGCFLLMMSIPLVMTGFLTLHALLILKTFILALIITLTLPKLLAPYLLVMALVMFGMQPGAWQVGTSIGVCFLSFLVLGIFALPRPKTAKR